MLFRSVYRRLQGVDAKHKLVIGVTDGGWSNGIESMKEIGRLPNVTTVSVLLIPHLQGNPTALKQYEDSGARLGGHITKVLGSPMGLPALIEEIVTHRMREVMSGYDGA